MVCMIFIVHTMHDCRCYLKMGLPRAYCPGPALHDCCLRDKSPSLFVRYNMNVLPRHFDLLINGEGCEGHHTGGCSSEHN